MEEVCLRVLDRLDQKLAPNRFQPLGQVAQDSVEIQHDSHCSSNKSEQGLTQIADSGIGGLTSAIPKEDG